MRAKVPFIRAIRTSVRFIFEQVPGIEPRSQAWKARVITVIRYLQNCDELWVHPSLNVNEVIKPTNNTGSFFFLKIFS